MDAAFNYSIVVRIHLIKYNDAFNEISRSWVWNHEKLNQMFKWKKNALEYWKCFKRKIMHEYLYAFLTMDFNNPKNGKKWEVKGMIGIETDIEWKGWIDREWKGWVDREWPRWTVKEMRRESERKRWRERGCSL